MPLSPCAGKALGEATRGRPYEENGGEEDLLCDVEGRPLSVASRHLSPPRGEASGGRPQGSPLRRRRRTSSSARDPPLSWLRIREGSRRRRVGWFAAPGETNLVPGARSFDSGFASAQDDKAGSGAIWGSLPTPRGNHEFAVKIKKRNVYSFAFRFCMKKNSFRQATKGLR